VGICEVQSDTGNVGRLVEAKNALAFIHNPNGEARVGTQLQLNLSMDLISGVDKMTLFAGAMIDRYLACCNHRENGAPRERQQMAV
jgi:hypothetical protein